MMTVTSMLATSMKTVITTFVNTTTSAIMVSNRLYCGVSVESVNQSR